MAQKHGNDISALVKKTAHAVQVVLGAGLLQAVHTSLMDHELRKLKPEVQPQAALPVLYDGLQLEICFGWTS